MTVAGTPRFEARPSIACDASGRVWVAWEEAPEIRLRRLLPEADNESFKVIAEATDDEGLAELWCRIDGKKIDYIDAKDDPRRRMRVELPWRPSDESQRVEIVATDADGRTSVYLSDL